MVSCYLLCTCSLLNRYSIATLILDKRPKAGDWSGCNPRQALIGADTGLGDGLSMTPVSGIVGKRMGL